MSGGEKRKGDGETKSWGGGEGGGNNGFTQVLALPTGPSDGENGY